MTPVEPQHLREMTKKAKDPVPRIGFFACSRLDRIVRVRPAEPGNFPKKATVRCPCGREHDVGLSWRDLGKGELMNEEVVA